MYVLTGDCPDLSIHDFHEYSSLQAWLSVVISKIYRALFISLSQTRISEFGPNIRAERKYAWAVLLCHRHVALFSLNDWITFSFSSQILRHYVLCMHVWCQLILIEQCISEAYHGFGTCIKIAYLVEISTIWCPNFWTNLWRVCSWFSWWVHNDIFIITVILTASQEISSFLNKMIKCC